MSSPSADGLKGNIGAQVLDPAVAFDTSPFQDDQGSEAGGDRGPGEDGAPLHVPGASITGHRARSGDDTVLGDVPRAIIELGNDTVSSEPQNEEEYRFVSEIPTTASRIEVQLEDRPGFDGAAFSKVPSDHIAKVMDEMEAERGDQWFQIMYEDNRVDLVCERQFTCQPRRCSSMRYWSFNQEGRLHRYLLLTPTSSSLTCLTAHSVISTQQCYHHLVSTSE
jgi:hypothetical protein